MRYFLDTEFVEGFWKPFFGKRRHFIDLISIGIVSSAGHKLYLISKDFDVDYIWYNPDPFVKDNVLKKIYNELTTKYLGENFMPDEHYEFSRGSMKALISKYGKTIEEIRNHLLNFFNATPIIDAGGTKYIVPGDPEIWAYYADYDWVVFCSIFGRMIDLPKGFPFFCRDLKQAMVDNGLSNQWKDAVVGYPSNEHNALADAIWDEKLYNAIEDAKEDKELKYSHD